jgi:polysaccharide pyruvyl transferase WcaK-like protein
MEEERSMRDSTEKPAPAKAERARPGSNGSHGSNGGAVPHEAHSVSNGATRDAAPSHGALERTATPPLRREPYDADLLASAFRLVRRAARVVSRADADTALQTTMAGFIELARSRYALDRGARWQPGSPLKMLLAGYAGTRNTGADVRVEEMIRQFRHLFGDDHLDLSILTLDPALSQNYFRTVKQLPIPDFFPKFLFDTVHEMHGVIACEGSMFKSKFANALSTSMVGALGLAGTTGKIAVGYGGEAGKMDPTLEDLVRRYCQDALIIARNEESRTVLGRLGVDSRAGTDTAWTFDPAPASVGERLLRQAGWDGKTPVLALCPINAFWWPVKPDVVKGIAHALGHESDAHYKSVYFHADSPEIREKQATYIRAIAEGVERYASEHAVFPIMVGMEQLDRRACEALDRELGGGHPVFVSDEHEMYEMVSVIRHAAMMLSSRYHAIVTSMPGAPGHGLVASAGITMDERIRNLMADRGTPELALEVDDPDLADKVWVTLGRLGRDRDELRTGIGRTVVKNLERMGEMGMALVDHVRLHHPEFPFRSHLGEGGDPWQHLPRLPVELDELVERHA